jgi:peptide deformylase
MAKSCFLANGRVKRAELVTLEYQDLEGKTHTLEADELLSVCLQHENDHLDGIVFVERLSMLKKQFILKKFAKKNKA